MPTISVQMMLSLFFWEFGDGGTSDLEDPIHYYTVEGTYPISSHGYLQLI
jgi:PKD repeat protein